MNNEKKIKDLETLIKEFEKKNRESESRQELMMKTLLDLTKSHHHLLSKLVKETDNEVLYPKRTSSISAHNKRFNITFN